RLIPHVLHRPDRGARHQNPGTRQRDRGSRQFGRNRLLPSGTAMEGSSAVRRHERTSCAGRATPKAGRVTSWITSCRSNVVATYHLTCNGKHLQKGRSKIEAKETVGGNK